MTLNDLTQCLISSTHKRGLLHSEIDLEFWPKQDHLVLLHVERKFLDRRFHYKATVNVTNMGFYELEDAKGAYQLARRFIH